MSGLGQRVLVVGDSCAGKTTLGERLSAELGLPLVDLDALYWGPGWTPPDRDEFRERVDRATSGGRWIVAGNYESQKDITWSRAETMVWLDLPLRVTIPRIIRRSWRRWRGDTLLWGTNRERFLPQFKIWSPQDSLIAWTVSRHFRRRRELAALGQDPDFGHLNVVRLPSADAIEDWTSRLI